MGAADESVSGSSHRWTCTIGQASGAKMAERRLEQAVGVELRPIEPERLQEPLAHERRIALVGNLLQDPAQDDRVHARIQGPSPGANGARAVRRRSGCYAAWNEGLSFDVRPLYGQAELTDFRVATTNFMPQRAQ